MAHSPEGTTRPSVFSGLHLAQPTQDPGPHFSAAVPHPSSSDAVGVPTLSLDSVLPLARLGPQLVAPQKHQELLVAPLLALALPTTLIPEVLTAPCSPAPRDQLVSTDFEIYDVSYIK